MTDYNLLAKAEIEKYRFWALDHEITLLGSLTSHSVELLNAKKIAATAIQVIIDALEEAGKKVENFAGQVSAWWVFRDRITHYTTLKKFIQDYKA